MVDGSPVYVNMKAVRVDTDGKHIIIGVNNINAQMEQQMVLDRVKEERITYSRIAALSGDFICIYTVDPESEAYLEYIATNDYQGLGLAKEGEHFFENARIESKRTIVAEDQDQFRSLFTRENVLTAIEKSGVYSLNYRLVIDGEPTYVCLKAAIVKEEDGPRLIVGVINMGAQIRRDREYVQNVRQQQL